MHLILLSESVAARRRLPLRLVDNSDGQTGETGLTFSAGEIKISKNGGAEGNHNGSVTELAAGGYYYEATQGELDTFGYLQARFIKTGVVEFWAVAQVVAFDPYDIVRLGLTGTYSRAVKTGTVVVDGGNTESAFRTNLSEADNVWRDTIIKMTGGANIDQVKRVTAFANSNGLITVAGGFTSVPGADDPFEMINR